jgi:hypothetical protein
LAGVVSESSFNHVAPSDPGEEADMRRAGRGPGERSV